MRKVCGKNDVFREHILSEIAIGVYREGERLPGERELGERYQVSRNTIRRGLAELEAAGIVCRRPPVGTFVSESALRRIAAPVPASPVLRVAFVMETDQLGNPELQQIFLSLRGRLSEEVELTVFLSDTCDRLFDGGVRMDVALLFGDYSDDEIRATGRLVDHLVICGRESSEFNFISCDNYAGGRLMAEALLRAGHRHIAALGPRGRADYCDFSRRLTGIRDVCREHGVAFLEYRMKLEESMNLTASTYFTLDHFLRLDPELTAVAALYDRGALAVIDCCRRRNLRVPEDISVIGFDDQCYVEFIRPPLTTVRSVGEEVGARLAGYIDAVLEGRREPFRETIKPLLIERGTVRRLN